MRRINDVTGRICELLPGADIPLQYPTAATMSNFQGSISELLISVQVLWNNL